MLKDDHPLSYHPHAIKWFSSSLYSYHLDQKGILHYLIEYSFTDYGNGNFPTIKKNAKDTEHGEQLHMRQYWR